jgi:hypothetical protein
VLSRARCQALLGPDCALTEAQFEQLRQDLYALAELAVESFLYLAQWLQRISVCHFMVCGRRTHSMHDSRMRDA